MKTECTRCGECCLKSSPTLQREDISLIQKGLIKSHHFYTVRIGELVRDNINNKLKINGAELIKIREKEADKGCIFYDEEGEACDIYINRPAQCAAFVCWDDTEFMRVYNSPKLTRKGVIQDNILLGLIKEHEKKCNYNVLDKLVRQIESDGENAVQEILALLRFDHQLRPFVSEKLGIEPAEMDFIFGRSLNKTIAMYGLELIKEPDGSFFLGYNKHL